MTDKEIWDIVEGKECKVIGFSRYTKSRVMSSGVCIGMGFERRYILVESNDGWDEGHSGSSSLKIGREGGRNRCFYIPFVDLEIIENDFITF